MTVDWIQRAQSLNLRIRNFVDGRYVSASNGDPLLKRSARDGSVLYELGSGDEADVDLAIASASRALKDGRWSKLPALQRKNILLRFASLIEQHVEELALLECLDVGKPISDALNLDVGLAVNMIRFNAGALDTLTGKTYCSDERNLSYQLRRPVGVVAGIVGWNFPIVLAASKIGPALAAGNSLVLKPSEFTSLSASRLAELAVEAGVPEGVFNVVHGAGHSVGAALSQHNDVDLLTFTGSSQTGKLLMVAAGQSNMKRLVLECGGKAPNIVFDDCGDLDAVADAVTARAFWNQGQVCTASSRLLIQEGIAQEFIEKLVHRVSVLVPADPLLPEARFGALVNREHLNKVNGYIDRGREEGATILYQSDAKPPYADGYYVAPIVFGDVKPQQSIAREEIFGPVLSVMKFRDEAEALNLANDTDYGLSAIAWTQSHARAHRLAHGINAGWVVINATPHPSGGPAPGTLPIEAHKQSGMGVKSGVEGLESYMTKSSVQLFY
jgi:acyl-CoA reductase-like NAD-dependent aldehyde dehydrogenase